MFYHLCAITLIILVLGLAIVRRCSLYSPLVISASIWLVVFVTGLLNEKRLYPIQEWVFIAWLIWFMATWLIFFLLSPSHVKSARTKIEIRRIPVDYTLPLLLLIVWLSYRFWVIGSTGPDGFFFNLRMSATNVEGLAHLGLVARFYPLIFALFLFEHLYSRRENRHLRFLLWSFMLLWGVGCMSKLSISTPILSWVILQGITGRLKVMKIVLLAAVLFASIMSVQFIRASASDESTIEDILYLYIYSPIVALGYMDVDGSLPVGTYVLRFFYVIASSLDIMPMPVMPLSYTLVPEPTNVYTAMGLYYYDFGLLGVLLGAVFFGLFFSYLYLHSVKRRGLGLVLFSGYSIALFMQFFADVLVGNFSGNLQFMIYASAVFLASRKVCYVR